MTDQQENDLMLVGLMLDGRTNPPLERLLAHYRAMDAQLACVRKTVTESLPKLDEAYRRYGCTPEKCEKLKCGRSWPCQANGIRIVANDLRDCLGIES